MTTLALTPSRILRSEWHKLWTVRSTWIMLTAATAVTLVIGIGMSASYEEDVSRAERFDPVQFLLFGTQFSQIFLAVVAVLFIAGEYGTGMVRSTMVAVPRRLPVLWSKAGVVAAVTFTTTLATLTTTFTAGQLFLDGTDKELSLTAPGVFGTLLASAAGLTFLTLIGLGLGALLRSVPGGITAFIGGVTILPEVLRMFPYDAMDSAAKYFPGRAAEGLMTLQNTPDYAATGPALLALTLWTAATLGVAALLLRRRDV
ncbi:ABC transporter permease [Streptomyces sp. NBC_00878]|uniref:ABC transporter permease n=1 Tax=Streptomyces sp. NBC_00878 TaxID=2975854 RepID=UPI00224C8105|nr:ABC transporter permease [Streptomyces sp. NBC_00878]MCX4906807.1 ABC transporter permease [Streptomyces sp. NBC_00878]